jgi:hypothetical protein
MEILTMGKVIVSIPRRLVAQLGLTRHRSRTARTADGIISFGIFGAVRLTVQGRDCNPDHGGEQMIDMF